MKKSASLLAFVVCLALLAGCTMTVDPNFKPQASSQMVEPEAAHWKTWVIESSDALRPAAPPDAAATQAELAEVQQAVAGRDEAALQQIAYWDAGSPSYRWIEIATEQGRKQPFSQTARIARGMALMNVAIYDAMVAAWDAKYAYNRPRPSQVDPTLATLVAVPNSPSYPSEHAVAAGAAAAILSYLYPDDAQSFEAKAEEAAQSRVLAGVQYPSDVQAGLELGRAVAEQVIERAKTDGSDAVWDGTMPTEAGHWTGENPIEPLMGTWKPWVLASNDEFRAPAPFAYDSPEKAAELTEIKAFTRTWQTNQKSLFWQSFDGVHTIWYDNASKRLFEHHLDADAPYAAYVYATLAVARTDAFIACWDSKYTYWAIRPFQLDPELVTLFPTPNHPSYPAAHGCVSGAADAALESLFPAEASSVRALADEAAWSRLWGGIHYRSDIEAGLALGRAVGQKVADHAQAMMQP